MIRVAVLRTRCLRAGLFDFLAQSTQPLSMSLLWGLTLALGRVNAQSSKLCAVDSPWL